MKALAALEISIELAVHPAQLPGSLIIILSGGLACPRQVGPAAHIAFGGSVGTIFFQGNYT